MNEPKAVEAIARIINDEGWTCTAHEPESFGACPDCRKAQTKLASEIITALKEFGHWRDLREDT